MTITLFFLGLIVGIFLNACADSLPADNRLHRPTCLQCGHPRPLVLWSGLIATLTRRRCPSCGTALPVRHLLVELGTGLVFILCWLRTGTTITPWLNILYSAILILILITDIEHRLILHVVTLPAILLSIGGAFINPAFDSYKRALLGGATGLLISLTLYWGGALFAWVLGKMRGQKISEVAFGFGDVTLLTFIGLVVGVPEIIFVIVIGTFGGGIFSLGYLVIRGLIQRKHKLLTVAFPYGPFFILGCAIMLFFNAEFMTWWMR